jgi:type 1 glutamine amidotransferase
MQINNRKLNSLMRILMSLLIPVLLIHSCSTDRAGEKKILIYSRTAPGYYIHDNVAASRKALEEICRDLRIQTVCSDTPAVFTSENLAGFDAIIFNNTNNEAFTTPGQKEAFRDFISSGKGFAGIHAASTSEPEWSWFRNMIGGTFLRHPPLQEFEIRVINPQHVSTAHLPEVWKWEDEPYYIHHFNPDIRVLLAADLRTIEDEKKEAYPGTTFGHYIPLAWVHRFEGGRQWYTALGHKIEHYDDPLFREHLKGGILWVLSLHE